MVLGSVPVISSSFGVRGTAGGGHGLWSLPFCCSLPNAFLKKSLSLLRTSYFQSRGVCLSLWLCPQKVLDQACTRIAVCNEWMGDYQHRRCALRAFARATWSPHFLDWLAKKGRVILCLLHHSATTPLVRWVFGIFRACQHSSGVRTLLFPAYARVRSHLGFTGALPSI